MAKRSCKSALTVCICVLFPTSQLLAWHNPQQGRYLQRDEYQTGVPVMEVPVYHGQPPVISMPSIAPNDHYSDGMNLFLYLLSNPNNARDPMGLVAGTAGAAGLGAYWDITYGKAALTAGGIALAILGGYIVANQWGVMGGMSAPSFDLFLDGVAASMTGAHATAEEMMTAAEVVTAYGVYSMSQTAAVKKAMELYPLVKEHWSKITTGGPNQRPNNHWAKEIQAWIGKIEQLAGRMKGKTAENFLNWARSAREGLEAILRGEGPNAPPPLPG